MATEAAGDLLPLAASAASVASCSGIVRTRRGCSQVGNIFGNRMAGANIGDANVRGFAGLAESVVARIEVLPFLRWEERLGKQIAAWICKFTYLQFVLKEVLLGGHFTVQAQQTLLLRAQRLDGCQNRARQKPSSSKDSR